MAVTRAGDNEGPRRRASVPATPAQTKRTNGSSPAGEVALAEELSDGPALASAVSAADLGGDLEGRLDKEFARLAQRALTTSERRLAQAVLAGRDVWASGFDPESVPVLAVALGAAAPAGAAVGPILFLSPETELLRARQVRFGARARTRLIERGCSTTDALGANALGANARGTDVPGLDAQVDGQAERAIAEPDAIDGQSADVADDVLWCSLDALGDPEVRSRLAARRFAAICVESAHAASPLAHETRFSLALLPALRAACGNPPLVAISRAVPEAVRRDAAARLGIGALDVHQVSLGAPTRLSVSTHAAVRADEQTLVELVERLPRPTVIFCDTPQEADTVFGQLGAAQVPVHRYHGAMSASERATEMLHFILPGRRAVMVATSAFRPGSGLAGVDGGEAATPEGLGLGYGKQRARSLLHLCVPASLEQYALELALLGTEEESEAVLFVGPADLRRAAAHLELVRTTPEQVETVAEILSVAEAPLQLAEVEQASGLGRKVVRRVLRLLADAGVTEHAGVTERAGITERAGSTEEGAEHGATVFRRVPEDALRQVASLLSSALGQMRDEDVRRLDAVAALLSTSECRRAFLETYMGATGMTSCGRCDVCVSATKGARVAPKRALESEKAPPARRRAAARSWSVSAPSVETLRVAAPTATTRAPRRAVPR